MPTAEEMGYREVEVSSFDYLAAGRRCHNMTKEQATDCFDSLANQYGVTSGSYTGSWDQFWLGFYGEEWAS